MPLDYIVRDPRGIAGMKFHIDGQVFTFTGALNHLLSCGFDSRESAGYMRCLLDEAEPLRLLIGVR